MIYHMATEPVREAQTERVLVAENELFRLSVTSARHDFGEMHRCLKKWTTNQYAPARPRCQDRIRDLEHDPGGAEPGQRRSEATHAITNSGRPV
jgi:hypothetical protein